MRTEEEKATQSPVLVYFGGKEYPIKPLIRSESREWRRKLAQMWGQLPRYASVTTDNPDQFQQALDSMMVAMPDQMAELVFEYAKDLPRDEIETVATDTDITKAFESIYEVAFPFMRALLGTIKRLSQ